MKSPIPKIIWQTYKDSKEDLDKYAQRCMHTWIVNNKSYEHRYLNDEEAGKLILSDYGKEWYELFINVPIGVVRGDIFRYLVIYRYGGVYSDLDTICRDPIDAWINGPIKKQNEYNSIFAAEIVGKQDIITNRVCQWTFASVPESPIFKNIIDNVYIALKNTDWSKIDNLVDAIHYISGPNIFTYSVLNTMGFAKSEEGKYIIDPKVNFASNSDYVNNSKYALENKVHIFGDKYFGIFNRKSVRHLYGGSNENWSLENSNYVQWKKENLNEKLIQKP